MNDYSIQDHLLQGPHVRPLRDTPNSSGPFSSTKLPDTLVIHYTGGGTIESNTNWLCNPQAKASAHLLIGKDGGIQQLLPFNHRAWHAGRSKWLGRSGLNNYSIGIELVNAGILEKREIGYYDTYGNKVKPERVIRHRHKNGGNEEAWESYTPEQIRAVEQVGRALFNHYNMRHLVGHDDISPGRKIDPGPAFPMERMREWIAGERDKNTSPDDPNRNLAIVKVQQLNIRSEPNGKLIGPPLEMGQGIKVLGEADGWAQVESRQIGWVAKQYIQKL